MDDWLRVGKPLVTSVVPLAWLSRGDLARFESGYRIRDDARAADKFGKPGGDIGTVVDRFRDNPTSGFRSRSFGVVWIRVEKGISERVIEC